MNERHAKITKIPATIPVTMFRYRPPFVSLGNSTWVSVVPKYATAASPAANMNDATVVTGPKPAAKIPSNNPKKGGKFKEVNPAGEPLHWLGAGEGLD